jgi:hypothetical protein
MKKGSNNGKRNGLKFWLRTFVISCFVIFFLCGHIVEAASGRENPMRSMGSAVPANAGLISDHNIFHFPFDSIPMSSEQDSSGQRQTNDNSDDDAKLFEGLFLKERFDLTSGKCLLLRLTHSCENRKDVSLFILHHSWKSFLKF